MKKIFLAFACVALIAIGVASNVGVSSSGSLITNLTLANVEALAKNENGSGENCLPGYYEVWYDSCLYLCEYCDGMWRARVLLYCRGE